MRGAKSVQNRRELPAMRRCVVVLGEARHPIGRTRHIDRPPQHGILIRFEERRRSRRRVGLSSTISRVWSVVTRRCRRWL
jgi:hypothetical protein